MIKKEIVINPEAENIISEILREEHRLNRRNEEDDFYIKNQNDILETQLEASDTHSVLVTCIAAISLIVGGIGILANMIMSVKERINEIGLRKAIGAKRQDVLIQFLLESAIMGISGGITGIAAGIITAAIISFLASWHISLPVNTIIFSFSFSVFLFKNVMLDINSLGVSLVETHNLVYIQFFNIPSHMFGNTLHGAPKIVAEIFVLNV